ncbi:MAG: AhpC/TSA family protein [Bacteroidales bacterium]|nr:AhpC/TSA family protein [Bacteroidales bacterium]
MIRKLICFLMPVLILSCDGDPGFVLNGQLSGAGNIYVYLARPGPGGAEIIDSARVEDGSFRFAGRLETPEPYILSAKGYREQKLFFLENEVISFTGSTDSIHCAVIDGSVTDSEYSEYESMIRPLNRRILTLFDNHHDAVYSGDNVIIESVDTERINSDIVSSALRFVREHPASFASPYILLSLQADLSTDSLDQLTGILAPGVKTSSQYQILQQSIDRMRSLEPGNPAPDFTQPSHTGTSFRLSETTGDGPLLIYFWASWCSSCTDATAEIATLYRRYQGSGLKVVSVSLDFSASDWIDAVKRDSMEWVNVSDLELWDNSVAVRYNVTEIPFFYLVDSDGVIVARGDDASLLDSLILAELRKQGRR